MQEQNKIIVKGQKVRVLKKEGKDYISLTDLARYVNTEDPSGLIKQWMSNRDSFDFYGLWETLNNPNFNSVKFHQIKINEVGKNRFLMSPTKWKKITNSIGFITSSGKYSEGTYAHSDIAFEFASWLSPEFKLYLITEFQRLKKKEANENKLDWNAGRILTKINYSLQTESIRENIVPILTERQKEYVYQNEADILNVALFGMTAREWEANNPNIEGNIRDNTDLLHLLVLSNLESLNSELIKNNMSQYDRLILLNNIARSQMIILKKNNNIQIGNNKNNLTYNK